MLERSHQGHIEADLRHAYVDANFNRGRGVLQRLKHDNHDFPSSVGIQTAGRASPVPLVASSMSAFRSVLIPCWAASHVLNLTSGPALDASVLIAYIAPA
jgi:hypothetical protein